MKVAFILDPSIDQDLLQQYILEYCDYDCKFYDIGDDYISLLKIQPNLIFLSTEITKISINELLDQQQELDFNLVMVSSNEKHAIKAFQYGAIHYIVTPFTKIDIKRVKEKLVMLKRVSTNKIM